MSTLNRILPIILGLALVLSGAVTSFGNAMAAGGQSMVICSGTGARDVVIGVNGEEVPALHDCEDCCVAVAVQAAPTPAITVLTRVVLAAFHPFSTQPARVWLAHETHARGPPVVS